MALGDNCRAGCRTKDHATWCHRSSRIKRQAYFRDLLADGKWRCMDCESELPLSEFYLRGSGRGKGRPTAARCRRHIAEADRRTDWKYNVNYADLLARQGGKCAICGTTEPLGKGRLHVDHDHSCCPDKRSCGACVRGLLCAKCNSGIGYFNDDIELMRKAISYVSAG